MLVALKLIRSHVTAANVLRIGTWHAALIGLQQNTVVVSAATWVTRIHRWAARRQGHSLSWSAIELEWSEHGINVVQITRSVEGTRVIAAQVVAQRRDRKAVRARILGDNAVPDLRYLDACSIIPADGAVANRHRTKQGRDSWSALIRRPISADSAVDDTHYSSISEVPDGTTVGCTIPADGAVPYSHGAMRTMVGNTPASCLASEYDSFAPNVHRVSADGAVVDNQPPGVLNTCARSDTVICAGTVHRVSADYAVAKR